ncbi:MAG: hypothetical protein ABGU93_08035 [Acetobacterium sp.]|uniref:hypothetical protein n=1 Tax=Acetobacterium sp. TaxID=1872094 RepID=UPI003242B049
MYKRLKETFIKATEKIESEIRATKRAKQEAERRAYIEKLNEDESGWTCLSGD